MDRRLIGGAVVLATAVAAGVFAGQFAWKSYGEHQALAAAAAASAAAAAEARTVRGQLRQKVREQMHDADAAQFRNDRASAKSATFWCGEVNGRNRMGAMVGFTRFTALLTMAGEEVVLADIDFSPVSPIGDSERLRAARFESQWQAMCEP